MVQDVTHPVDFTVESFDADGLGLVRKSAWKPAERADGERRPRRHAVTLFWVLGLRERDACCKKSTTLARQLRPSRTVRMPRSSGVTR